jgi:hypothetical protein
MDTLYPIGCSASSVHHVGLPSGQAVGRRIEERMRYNTPMRIFMIGNRMGAFALSMALAIICSTPSAIAAQFDGHWSMVAVTTSGHCGEIPIDVGISRGRIYSTGGSSFGTAFAHYPIQLVGRVSASGQVRMNAVAGPRSAQGTGRFNRFRGSGTWAGTGPSGICSGVWTASRSYRLYGAQKKKPRRGRSVGAKLLT